jgi:predicted RecA/RadA family phage recombinase
MRFLKDKKGFELTISFIVSLILAIAVLGGSLVLVNKFFGVAQQEKASIDAQTESQIISMLSGGSKVAIPVNRVEAKTGKLVTFGVGILNVLRNTPTDSDTFVIKASDCGLGTSAILTPSSQDAIVRKNDRKIFLVAYKIPAGKAGSTYICNINVLKKSDGKDYAEPVYKAYIKVT